MFNTYIHPTANNEVSKLLSSGLLSEGELVRQFELDLEKELGIKNCITVNSGTSALHLALVLAGIGEGDEVIIPAQTFIATGLVVIQQKAIPVFADIDYQTGNISVKSISDKITSKTKAIIPVHWAGYPCDMDQIQQLANQYNLKVIEDSAHALGASYKGKPIGTLSDYTCFSFQAIKHLTTGDGGAVCLGENQKFEEAVSKRWFGINRHNSPQTELGERSYNVEELGFKYHLNNYGAALGIANLRDFFKRLSKRIEIANLYTSELSKVSGIKLLNYQKDRQSAYWLYCFHVENRERFIRALKVNGVNASVVHQRIDRNKIFGGLNLDLENQEKFDRTQIHIPIHDDIDIKKAERIVSVIKMGW